MVASDTPRAISVANLRLRKQRIKFIVFLVSQPIQLINDLVDEPIRLLNLRVDLLGALFRPQVVFQIVSHVVDSRQLNRLQPIDERVRLRRRLRGGLLDRRRGLWAGQVEYPESD